MSFAKKKKLQAHICKNQSQIDTGVTSQVLEIKISMSSNTIRSNVVFKYKMNIVHEENVFYCSHRNIEKRGVLCDCDKPQSQTSVAFFLDRKKLLGQNMNKTERTTRETKEVSQIRKWNSHQVSFQTEALENSRLRKTRWR